MNLSIIVIGDEILIGQVTDTNSGYISRKLGPLGWSTRRVLTVGDDADDIHRAIGLCMADSDLIITTGGLGPTKDDITKAVMLDIFGGEMIYDASVAENIRRVFEIRGLNLNRLTEGQAMVPSSCRVIQNELGTAPVMWFERDGHVLVAMPGVPFETEGMIERSVADCIARHFSPDRHYAHRVLMVTGITESALAERLERYEASLSANLHLAYLPTPGLIRLRLDCVDSDRRRCVQAIDAAYAALCDEVGPYAIHQGDATAAEIVLGALRRRGLKVATAESCTGGNIAHSITAVAGCSDVYVGSVVSYANEVKTGVLGVNAADIEQYGGAVSRQVVEQMAAGVARLTNADCAVATSGIAGPAGGSDLKPVGTVWTAVLTPSGVKSFVKRYPGSRERVIDRATTEALLALALEL